MPLFVSSKICVAHVRPRVAHTLDDAPLGISVFVHVGDSAGAWLPGSGGQLSIEVFACSLQLTVLSIRPFATGQNGFRAFKLMCVLVRVGDRTTQVSIQYGF